MRTYHLYLINAEFASQYIGREYLFVQLFKEFETAIGELQTIITKQIHYITKPIPEIQLHQLIRQHLLKRKQAKSYYIEYNQNSWASLKAYDRFIRIEAEGSYEVEAIFFEALRKSESSYLAIDLYNDRYGWLSPIKERKSV